MKKLQLKQVRNQSQYEAHTRTHASTPRSLGKWVLEIEYIKLSLYLFPLMLSCRNVTLQSKNIVSERDTLIQ